MQALHKWVVWGTNILVREAQSVVLVGVPLVLIDPS